MLIALFTDRISQSLDGSLFTAFVGWLFLPITELCYVVMFWWNGDVSGFSWFVVALGFLLDLSSTWGTFHWRSTRRAQS
ncbi:unannotated protein [freshwater metagenome]|uniref:Unannotated protein n=1 Tax=freshwater metagenome TaxID=449393 RepID=A0A6J5ZC80_9ZZZZ